MELIDGKHLDFLKEPRNYTFRNKQTYKKD